MNSLNGNSTYTKWRAKCEHHHNIPAFRSQYSNGGIWRENADAAVAESGD
ncbi:hypothetical protein [Glutamicibacter halophytocola]|nr:hypothetical protein [Glutamicibacter halophytocola]NQD39811.1 hypothetical protein [Glutamicibacter halophytocola]